MPIRRHSLARAERRAIAHESNLARATNLARSAWYAGIRGDMTTAEKLLREIRRIPNIWEWRVEGKKWIGDYCTEVRQELSI